MSVRSTSVVKVEGAWYSVPSRWARLDATAYVGVEEVRIACRGEEVIHPRERFGGRRIRYQHYHRSWPESPRRYARWRRNWWRSWESPNGRLWQLLLDTYCGARRPGIRSVRAQYSIQKRGYPRG